MHRHRSYSYMFDFGKLFIYLFIYLHITNIILKINTDYSLKGFNWFVFLRHWLCFFYEARAEVLGFKMLTLCLKGLMTLSVSQIM